MKQLGNVAALPGIVRASIGLYNKFETRRDGVLPLSIMIVRAIGVMHMADEGEPDDKVIAVPLNDPAFADVTDIEDIPKHTYREIKRFFEDYKVLEEKSVVVDEIRGAAEGLEAVKQGLAYYRKEENRLRGWG